MKETVVNSNPLKKKKLEFIVKMLLNQKVMNL